MSNLDSMIEAIHTNPPSAKYGFVSYNDVYDYLMGDYKNSLIDFLCSTAEKVGYDIRRIDESPADKQALLEAIKYGISIGSGVPIYYAVTNTFVSDVITDAAIKYRRRRPDFIEDIKYILKLLLKYIER